MVHERDNAVPAAGQLPADGRMRAEGSGRPRVLFLGNSITLHGPNAALGWSGDHGMAASRAENDYVHVLMAQMRAHTPQASLRIGQLADWERAFWKDEEVLEDFRALRDWAPDVIFSVILGANTPDEALTAHNFAAHYRTMLRYFNPNGHARVCVTTMFWPNAQKDASVRLAAELENATLVELGDLGVRDDMMALTEYTHRGVAMHPGDAGMREIATRLWRAYTGYVM